MKKGVYFLYAACGDRTAQRYTGSGIASLRGGILNGEVAIQRYALAHIRAATCRAQRFRQCISLAGLIRRFKMNYPGLERLPNARAESVSQNEESRRWRGGGNLPTESNFDGWIDSGK
jgi:hypothetical protein